MKNIVFTLLASLLFVSCSKDETNVKPADGQYIVDSMDLVICMFLKNGECAYFAPFLCGKVVSNWRDVSTSGDYPNYVYRIGDLTITANFESPTVFSAVLDGVLNTSTNTEDMQTGTQIVFGDNALKFVLDNRTLDANGDGILDEMQPDLFGK